MFTVQAGIDVLERTPAVLRALLEGSAGSGPTPGKARTPGVRMTWLAT